MVDRADLGFEFELLRELTEASGAPGYETQIREIVRRELEGVADVIRTDGMGNVVGTIEGSGREILVGAHMDEIGFMVTHVTDDGFLEIDPLGGWDPAVLSAQRVTVHTETGGHPGVIGAPPPHTSDDDADPAVEDAHVDLGLSADTARERVEVGDIVTMRQSTELLGEHVTGKALDDRVCLFAVLSAIKRAEPTATVHVAATVQEEVGIRGAKAVGSDLDPDVAIALDVTVAGDVPDADPGQRVTELGEGTAIKLKDSSVITNPEVNARLRSLAEDREIPHQLEVLPSGGTDTAGFQRSGGPVPAGALSVPTRYLHTVTEGAHHADIEATIDLLAAFLETETDDREYQL
jgi:putative aminopeptidase FrvX